MKKIALLTLIALFLLAAPARAQISLLHEFAGGTGDGKWPYGSLLMSGSTLYGMTQFGGSEDSGTVFKMQADGSGFTVLHEFAWAAGDGNGPMGSLILSGSTLYGMTRFGGTSGSGFGTIFKIDTDGTGFALLHSFVGGADDGKYPIGTLTLYGTTLFGMTQLGGDNDQGTIFKMETDGTDFALLHDLSYSDGQQPNGSLILSGSTLYGVAPYGGSNSKGTVFKLQTDGSGYTKLHEFAGGGADGENSWGSLVLAGGYLYGLTSAGGDLNRGTIFKVKTDGTGFSLLHEFAGGTSDGRYPLGSLALSGSTLCGMTPNGGDVDFAGTVFKVQTDGSGYAVLHEFTGGAADGYQPYGDVIISGSTLYGMTSSGGDSNRGVVFSLPVTVDPSLTLTSPNGGESWTAGESHDITWTSGGTVGDVHIDYSTDGGDNWLSVAADEANDGSYSWTVPNAPSTSCLVRISESDGDPLDGSNSMFTILPPPTITVTSPNGGESWAAASTQEITWTSTGTVGNIDIIYSTNGGLNWNSIIVDTANDGSHLWTVPDTPSDNCYVQLLEHADSFPGDSSDTVFSIVTTPSSLTISGTITCGEAPLAGVVMSGLPGNPHTNPAGFYTASVDYDWSGTVTPALAGYAFNPASRGYANVTADQTSQDYAASMVPALRLTAPNGGEHWTLGETRSITWDAVAYTGTVRLVLFKGGVRFGNIATGVRLPPVPAQHRQHPRRPQRLFVRPDRPGAAGGDLAQRRRELGERHAAEHHLERQRLQRGGAADPVRKGQKDRPDRDRHPGVAGQLPVDGGRPPGRHGAGGGTLLHPPESRRRLAGRLQRRPLRHQRRGRAGGRSPAGRDDPAAAGMAGTGARAAAAAGLQRPGQRPGPAGHETAGQPRPEPGRLDRRLAGRHRLAPAGSDLAA